MLWDDDKKANQLWYLQYVEDGWFYIRSRYSAKCLSVFNALPIAGAGIVQWDSIGGTHQQWRLVRTDANIDFNAPNPIKNLSATANAASIQLNWTASTEADVTGYIIFRSETAEGPFNTIARDISANSFVDNTCSEGIEYFYKIKAIDKCQNKSTYSNPVSATVTNQKDLVAKLQFDNNTLDSTVNLNHGATYGSVSYTSGKSGNAIVLNGVNNFVQLSPYLVNHKELSIATWVYRKGGAAWQRIFDFGNDQNEYMFLTAASNTGKLRFAIKNGGNEQILDGSGLATGKWTHVALTISETATCLYVDGGKVAESNAITISQTDFKPILNYIGRSQYPDPMFNGYIDDFRVYNYALTDNNVAQLAGTFSDIKNLTDNKQRYTLFPIPANNSFQIKCDIPSNAKAQIIMNNMDGRTVLDMQADFNNTVELNSSNLASGIYLIKIIDGESTFMKKIIINH